MKLRLRPGHAEQRAIGSGTLARVLENAAWLFGGRGVAAILSLIYLGMATRTLGPAGFGQFVLVLGTAQLVSSFVTFQTWQAVVRFGMEPIKNDDWPRLGSLFSFFLALDLTTALAGCVLAALVVIVLGPALGWDASFQLETFFFCLAMLLPVRSTAMGILRLNDRFGLSAVADAMNPIARLIGALMVVFVFAPSVEGFLIAWAVAETVTAAAYWLLVILTGSWRRQRTRLATLHRVPAEHPGLWQFLGVTNVGTTLGSVAKQGTVLLVGLAVGPAAAGAYRIAHQLGQALARVSELLSRALFAELARVHVEGASAQLSLLFRKSSRLALGAGTAIVLILLLAGRPVLRLVAGPEFVGAYPLLLILGIAAAIDMVGVSFEPALLATGRAGQALRLRLAATAVLLVLLAILLPAMGVTGAAIATLAAALVGLTLFGIAAWRAIHPRNEA